MSATIGTLETEVAKSQAVPGAGLAAGHPGRGAARASRIDR